MSGFDGRRSDEDTMPVVKDYEGFGELVTGGSNPTNIIVTALCLLDNPQVNQYLLDSKLNLQDRITKTRIFPREGMALVDGEYHEPTTVEVIELPDTGE